MGYIGCSVGTKRGAYNVGGLSCFYGEGRVLFEGEGHGVTARRFGSVSVGMVRDSLFQTLYTVVMNTLLVRCERRAIA